jgi:predicted metal-binding protein
MAATLHVCTTCKRAGEEPAGETRPGALLHAALVGLPLPEGVTIAPVECLSACAQGCAVALSAPGKWSYVYGRLDLGDAGAILSGAGLYAASDNGLPPWRERPEIFRKQCLARIPPQE